MKAGVPSSERKALSGSSRIGAGSHPSLEAAEKGRGSRSLLDARGLGREPR